MDFTGIIAEYDPFHNGHAAQLAAVRAAGAQCIAVCMSSGAVQRGGVPILPESVRVRAALDAGADLVIALPAPYACATAEQFAAAGVHLLAALGCDTLAFGAETPDAAALLDTARLLDGEELNARIRRNLATGMTYAAARAAAADALHPGTGGLLRTPNNILGIEYCKAILHRHAALTPLALPRLGAAHGGGAGAHAGTPMASATRKTINRTATIAFRPPLCSRLLGPADQSADDVQQVADRQDDEGEELGEVDILHGDVGGGGVHRKGGEAVLRLGHHQND